ncbi:hypothetical protein BV22DRAFT_1050657 [Leucogyrophana mollusca]|uniref:Uncharacterized protein n=1 Tax=Leucogyrophana mollusca TaxID=85980 RepID=A0ACB8B3Q5_9AGAM|nr:hypothetical protein BV22DRAFT_1050657 [Leucogyrophana mollusca]
MKVTRNTVTLKICRDASAPYRLPMRVRKDVPPIHRTCFPLQSNLGRAVEYEAHTDALDLVPLHRQRFPLCSSSLEAIDDATIDLPDAMEIDEQLTLPVIGAPLPVGAIQSLSASPNTATHQLANAPPCIDMHAACAPLVRPEIDRPETEEEESTPPVTTTSDIDSPLNSVTTAFEPSRTIPANGSMDVDESCMSVGPVVPASGVEKGAMDIVKTRKLRITNISPSSHLALQRREMRQTRSPRNRLRRSLLSLDPQAHATREPSVLEGSKASSHLISRSMSMPLASPTTPPLVSSPQIAAVTSPTPTRSTSIASRHIMPGVSGPALTTLHATSAQTDCDVAQPNRDASVLTYVKRERKIRNEQTVMFGVQSWIWNDDHEWESVDEGACHPVLPNRRLWLQTREEPSWITRKTATTYRGRGK